jgi:hypothetical protein
VLVPEEMSREELIVLVRRQAGQIDVIDRPERRPPRRSAGRARLPASGPDNQGRLRFLLLPPSRRPTPDSIKVRGRAASGLAIDQAAIVVMR